MIKNTILTLLMLASQLICHAQNDVVKVDLSTLKSYGKTNELQRDKFFNSHMSPGNEFSDEELNYLKKNKMGMGRNFMLPNPASEEAKRNDTLSFKKKGKNWGNALKAETFYSPEIMRPIILTAHPTPGKSGEMKDYAFHWKGLNADYSSEAKWIANFLQYYFVDNKIDLPQYIEPMNEPYVHAGDYKKLGAPEADVRLEMARYHKALASYIHKKFPSVMVGGFASAWPYMEGFHSDFEHWNSRMKMFIDTVGDDLGFVSFHIYDGKNIKGDDCFRSGSNMEGIMDLVEGYTAIKFGQPKPLLISEHGMTRNDWLGKPYNAERDWKTLRSLNHQTVQFMMRPDNILKCIPFITGKTKWNKGPNPYPWVISKRTEDGKWEWTHLIKYFEFWKDLSGKYIDITSSNPDVLSLAFLNGKTIFVVLNNLENDTNVDIDLLSKGNGKIKSIKIKRLYNKNGVPVLEKSNINKDSHSILLKRDETIILAYEFDKKIKPSQKIESKKYYATEYLKKIKSNSTESFTVPINNGKIKYACLKLGIARPHGFDIAPTQICLNGKTYSFPKNWKGYDQEDRIKEGFFGVIDIPVSVEDLQNNNIVTLKYNNDGGTISTVGLQIDYSL